jgi:SAM-dependent methyltransferase
MTEGAALDVFEPPRGEAPPKPSGLPHSEALWQEVECGSYGADLPLWRELADAAPSASDGACELLDLGCGTGRVSLALAKHGCRVTGLDFSPELVEVLSRRAAALRIEVSTAVADARAFELPARFDLVIAPMQLVQLLRSSRERSRMFNCIARHLKPGGRAALALLDPEDEPGVGEPPPVPDMREANGWVYASQPVAVHRRGATTIVIERMRQVVSPGGDVTEQRHRDLLTALTCESVEQEAMRAGLQPERRRTVPATRDHVGSVIVVLGSDG